MPALRQDGREQPPLDVQPSGEGVSSVWGPQTGHGESHSSCWALKHTGTLGRDKAGAGGLVARAQAGRYEECGQVRAPHQ